MATLQTVQPGSAAPGRTVINDNFAALNTELGQKETPTGAQEKADTAEANAKTASDPAGTAAAATLAHDRDPAAHVNNIDFSSELSEAGYIDLTGSEIPDDLSHWLRSAYIPVTPGDSLSINGMGHPAINAVSFYTNSHSYISGVPYAAEAPAMLVTTVTVPSGAAYARLCCADPVYSISGGYVSQFSVDRSVMLALILSAKNAEYKYRMRIAPTAPRRMKLQPSDKILLYGDSIFSADYPWMKTAMESLTGAICYNGGFSGVSAAGIAADSRLQRVWDYGARLCVVMVGGNDSGSAGTVGTFDGSVDGEAVVTETSIATDYSGSKFIQAVSHIIRKFAAHYADIRTRANLTGAETESEKTAKIDAVIKPTLVFCTGLPQKRNNADDPFSMPANWQRKRDAVVECCAKYGVHCVDLYTKANFDMSVEPYWVSPTDVSTNNGVRTMDGLHPNKWGYQDLAEIICAETGI